MCGLSNPLSVSSVISVVANFIFYHRAHRAHREKKGVFQVDRQIIEYSCLCPNDSFGHRHDLEKNN